MNHRWAVGLLALIWCHLSACQMFRDTDAIELQNAPCGSDVRAACGCDAQSARAAECPPPGDTSPPRDVASDLDATAPDGTDSNTDTSPDTEPRGVRIVDCSTVDPAVTIAISNRTFVDGSPGISAGEVVEWTNEDDEEHAVVSGENEDDPEGGRLFDSGPIPVDGSYCVEFSSGIYPYFCDIRGADEMSGTISVE